MYPNIIYEVFVPKHQYLRSWISDTISLCIQSQTGYCKRADLSATGTLTVNISQRFLFLFLSVHMTI